jgi:hypothetical protein
MADGQVIIEDNGGGRGGDGEFVANDKIKIKGMKPDSSNDSMVELTDPDPTKRIHRIQLKSLKTVSVTAGTISLYEGSPKTVAVFGTESDSSTVTFEVRNGFLVVIEIRVGEKLDDAGGGVAATRLNGQVTGIQADGVNVNWSVADKVTVTLTY